jgi:hypothetical protein
MGYAATTIVVYGVPVTQEQAKEINDNLIENYEKAVKEGRERDYTEALLAQEEKDFHLRTMRGEDEEKFLSRVKKNYTPLKSKLHDTGCGGTVYDVQLFADGADSRIDSMHYSEEGHDHYFGVYVGSKGYAYHDQIGKLAANIPKAAKANLEKYVRPVLKKMGIKDEPEVHLINQVW